MPLQIIGTGLARTGTMSLKLALEQLEGRPCFHMIELMKAPERLPFIKRKEKNWASFFEGFHSSVDYPACIFYEELLKLNPAAKIIHTVRAPESWYDSVYSTVYRGKPKGPKDIFKLIYNLLRSKDMRKLAPIFKHNDQLIWSGQFESKFDDKDFAISVFQQHEEQVRRTVPRDQLLIFDVKDGWGPLCEFLGHPVPDTPFPYTNQKPAFNRKMDLLLEQGVFEP